MAGKKLLQQGIIWRVGNGQQIRVCHDEWLPNSSGNLLHLKGLDKNSNMIVAELMSDEGVGWNLEKIVALFPSDIVKKILTIPLPYSRGMDRQIWKHTKNGIYTVRSGYYIAGHMRGYNQSVSSLSRDASPLWQWIQKINTLPRIRFFLWKCAKCILPVSSELRKKHVDCDILCRRCAVKTETIEHVLRDREWSYFHWAASPLRLTIDATKQTMSMFSWLEEISRIKEPKVHSIFAVLLWTNWKIRNKLVFQHKTTPHQVGFEMAMKLVSDCWGSFPRTIATSSQSEIQNWEKPRAGWWKVNIDAAVRQGGGVGLGVVIRDERGKVIAVRCIMLPICVEAEVGEALACQEGLILAREFGGGRIILETDCQTIQVMLHNKREDYSYLGEIVNSTMVEATHFENVIYSWARRNANMMTHSLAKLATSNSVFFFYTRSLPNIVIEGLPSAECCSSRLSTNP